VKGRASTRLKRIFSETWGSFAKKARETKRERERERSCHYHYGVKPAPNPRASHARRASEGAEKGAHTSIVWCKLILVLRSGGHAPTDWFRLTRGRGRRKLSDS